MTKKTRIKLSIFIAYLLVSIIIFIFRPRGSDIIKDTAPHFLFYFITSAILNGMFNRYSISKHLLIFSALMLFGVSIELLQCLRAGSWASFSVHDVTNNFKGLIAFSILWGFLSITQAIAELILSKIKDQDK